MSASEYRRVRFVERELAHGRRLVQALDADAPTQLSGSAPLIWDLLADNHSVDEIVALLQQRFSDAPEVIADGVRVALDSLVQASLVTSE
jgi:hypothetical protein